MTDTKWDKSMLDSLRKGAGTWVAKVFLGLLILSFAIWGVADVFTGANIRAVATVGTTEIPALSYERAYRREIQNMSQQMGRQLTYPEAAAIGLPARVLSQLITQATLSNAATNYKLGISDDALAKLVRDNPQFHGPAGKFDRSYFQQLLRSVGMSEEAFVLEQRDEALRRQIVEGLVGELRTPEIYLKAVNTHRNEQRTIKYIVIKPDTVEAVGEPTESTLNEFFAKQKAAFRAPEYRALELLKVEPEDVARPGEVTQDEILAEYQAKGSKYIDPEKRQVHQVLFDRREDAEAARKKLDSGVTYEELAKDRGLKEADTDLGLITKSAIADKAVATAAFDLALDGVSQVVVGRFGPVLIKVSKIVAENRTPLANIADDLRNQIAKAKGVREVLQLHDDIEDALAGGSSLAEIATKFRLKLRIIDGVDAIGRDVSGTSIADLPAAAQLLKAAFDSDVDVENEPLQVNQRGFLWYSVATVTPGRDRSLDEIRDKVAAAWKDQEIDKSVGQQATDTIKRLKDGADLDAIADGMKLTVETSVEFNRAFKSAALPTDVVTAAFAGPKGYIGSASGPGNQRFIFVVDQINEPAFFVQTAEMRALSNEFASQLSETLLNQYVQQLQSEYGISVNQPLLTQIVSPSGV
jgi:peptidyl-prolyl cis-trans isomerase D